MGEFEDEEFGRKGATDATSRRVGAGPAADASGEVPSWRVRARRVLSEEYILEEVEAGSLEAARVLSMHQTMKTRARLYAHQLRQLSTFFREDPAVQGLLDDADVTALKVATGLRCSYFHARAQVTDAHTAVEWMPLTFEHLRAGDLPEAWHHSLIRHVRRLSEDQVRQVDAHMAGVELPSVSKATFDKQVTLAVALALAGTVPTPPSESRDVEIVDVNTETGTASLYVTGPIPEIQALAHRLDIASRTVQKAQRAGLEDGAEGPLPFDIDENLHDRGRALSLRTLRYAILVHSVLDIDPVQETSSPYKILVTVPATTLLGVEDAPAMLEGMTPIPAEQARQLAAGESTWQRILTDPLTGAHLPVTADTYHPTTQMRLQLRLRHPVCAVPGCTRATVIAAEDDHIIEYDHDHPGRGGQTSLWNLHRLCWLHHKLKTAGLIDPTRDPEDDPRSGDGSTTAGPWETSWTLDGEIRTRTRENTDLLTPHTVEALERAWRVHQRAHADAMRLHAEEKARPHEDRAAEQRADAYRRAYPSRRSRRIIPPGPTPEETDPPF
ncbi:HNH endonuclease signature motif containing protein [Brachybacterium vulturis]|uniref:HNH endonuclease signature motif containing protein n=1 Tax=Brachybacterium vulturis TaxID=2017484 RepID=UPI001FE3E229|nr:HNH endonuclease signature motif containing protein [Brachybacterium vulturis]